MVAFKPMLRAAADALYPPGCMICGADVADAGALCGGCWSDTQTISGAVCESCGVPLAVVIGGAVLRCEQCRGAPRNWGRGRAAALYGGGARALVLALKHGDRPEMARPMAAWMARAGRDVLVNAEIVIPAPMHWRRLIARRFNQAAELSRAVARSSDLRHAPDALRRVRATPMQGFRSAEERRENMRGAFGPGRRAAMLKGRRVLLVDDVMTTGATLDELTGAAFRAGAVSVDVLVFARADRVAQNG